MARISSAAGLLAVLATLALASPSRSQTSPVDPGQDIATPLADIEVSATRSSERQARGFVEQISRAPIGALSIATWMTPICIATVNLREETAVAIRARIEAHARDFGVAVQSAGCSPNITLLATSDGRFTATDLVDAYRNRFIASDGPTQGDGRALRRFAEAEVAVRWWPISALTDEGTGRILVPIWGAPAAVSSTPGELYFGQNRREALLTTLVILDLSKTGTASEETLADYLTMVVLANIDPDARGGGRPTILDLWDAGPAPTGLTRWDRAYLKALYEAPVRLGGGSTQLRSLYQRTEMARIMARELAQDDAAP